MQTSKVVKLIPSIYIPPVLVSGDALEEMEQNAALKVYKITDGNKRYTWGFEEKKLIKWIVLIKGGLPITFKSVTKILIVQGEVDRENMKLTYAQEVFENGISRLVPKEFGYTRIIRSVLYEPPYYQFYLDTDDKETFEVFTPNMSYPEAQHRAVEQMNEPTRERLEQWLKLKLAHARKLVEDQGFIEGEIDFAAVTKEIAELYAEP
jgi:hypothetical protein